MRRRVRTRSTRSPWLIAAFTTAIEIALMACRSSSGAVSEPNAPDAQPGPASSLPGKCAPEITVRVTGPNGEEVPGATALLHGSGGAGDAVPLGDGANVGTPAGGHYLLRIDAPDHESAIVPLALTCSTTELQVSLPAKHGGHPNSAPRAETRLVSGAPQTREVLALYERVQQCPRNAVADRRAAIAEHSPTWAAMHWRYDWPTVWSTMADEARAETSELLAAARWMAWLACDARGTLHTPGRDNHILEVIRAVPPESPLWSWSAKAIRTTAELLPAAAVDEYLDNFDAANHDPHARAAALHWRLEEAEALGNRDAVAKLYTRLRSELAETEFGSYAKLHDPERATAPGKVMPAFSVMSERDGKRGRLSNDSLRGQPYLLDIWATWCRPCVRGLPELHRMYEEHGLVIVSASEEEAAVVESFRAEHQPMPWDHVLGEQAALLRRSLKTITAMPTLVLVDADGRIIASSPRLTAENLHEFMPVSAAIRTPGRP